MPRNNDARLQVNSKSKWYNSMKMGKPEQQLWRNMTSQVLLLDRWINQAQTTGSFKEKDNLSSEEEERIALRKENQRLKMEVDILKQAALIMGRK